MVVALPVKDDKVPVPIFFLDTYLSVPYLSAVLRGSSSVGRALEWHSRGQRFDPALLHFLLLFLKHSCGINTFFHLMDQKSGSVLFSFPHVSCVKTDRQTT